ncbi:hypothetical protein IC235_17515 [Hymenobacter sp. BT664]|uniref:Baseplate J-like C-terminal domain-containing protein n=1 Tax=Hymenobacter montanus TaxID=2771359 RepID=A0A927GL09_9BACT|nr:hypothetical protein [Hymenobacter montanus]MBD2769691.1 hypothetical protein [Hymenobacter montanus]
MARTIDEIETSILDEIAATPELAGPEGLTSPSAVAIYRLLAYVMAVVLRVHETIFDRHMADVDAKLARAQPGTAQWYAIQVKKFQQGDQLVVDDDGIHYPAGSTGLKLVTQATAKENYTTNQLFLKLATDDASAPGGLRALTGPEMTQVRGYIAQIRFPGTRIVETTGDADRLKVLATVYFNPLVNLDALKAAVRAALRLYLASLDFDGLVYLSKIEDAIQSVAGVKDVLLGTVSARNGTGQAVAITRFYETVAGFIVEDDAAGDGFLDTITFVPNAQ